MYISVVKEVKNLYFIVYTNKVSIYFIRTHFRTLMHIIKR